MQMPRRVVTVLMNVALLGVMTTPVLAVKPGKWVHSTESDFAQGKTQNVVITNLNQIKLATGTTKLAELPDPLTLVNDVMKLGDRVVIAAGPEGRVLSLSGDKLDTLLELPEHQVFALAMLDKDQVLVAASGEPSRLIALSAKGESKTLVELDGVRYVWDMLVVEGKVYLATGVEGRLLEVTLDKLEPVKEGNIEFRISNFEKPLSPRERVAEVAVATEAGEGRVTTGPEIANNQKTETPSPLPSPGGRGGDAEKGKSAAKADQADDADDADEADIKLDLPAGVREIFHAKQTNLLCLGIDGQKRLYAGSDSDGLVYRLTPSEKADTGFDVFVLLDAAEPEIGAILVQPDGTVYVGTADAMQARPGRMTEASSMPMGRPGSPGSPSTGPEGDAPAPAPGDDIPSVPPKPTPHEPPAQPQGGQVQGDQTGVVVADAKDKATGEKHDGHDANHHGDASPRRATGADPLREIIRQRMNQGEAAEQAAPMLDMQEDPAPPGAPGDPGNPAPGEPAPGPGQPRQPGPRRPMGPGGPMGMGAMMAGMMQGMGMQQGNAVYRIDPQGFVTELFRESVMILQLSQINGQLLVTTGNEGMIFRIDPVAGETLRLVDLENQQIPALAALPDGEFLLGTANPVHLVRLHAGYAEKGDFTSISLDATQISLWGQLVLFADVPADTTLTLQTRSGNVQDPEHAPWSAWSEPIAWVHDVHQPSHLPRRFAVTSPPARFLQYRLNLTGTPTLTPTASRIELAYITPNQKPVITAVRATYPHQQNEGSAPGGSGGGPAIGGPGGGPGGGRGMPAGMNPAMMRAMMQARQGNMGGGGVGGGSVADVPEAPQSLPIEWDASDPNGDQLQFKVEYQPMGATTWVLLEEELTDPRYEWAIRRMPDGWYRVRVTAGDILDNPASMAMTVVRESDPILIDNTPPEFRNVQMQVDKGQLMLTAEVFDALSPISEVRYALNSTKDWQPVLPDDKIFDSTNERITIKLFGLRAGQQVLTLRAIDGMGQVRFHAVMLEIKP